MMRALWPLQAPYSMWYDYMMYELCDYLCYGKLWIMWLFMLWKVMNYVDCWLLTVYAMKNMDYVDCWLLTLWKVMDYVDCWLFTLWKVMDDVDCWLFMLWKDCWSASIMSWKCWSMSWIHVVLSSHVMRCFWNWNVFLCYVICHVM